MAFLQPLEVVKRRLDSITEKLIRAYCISRGIAVILNPVQSILDSLYRDSILEQAKDDIMSRLKTGA